MLTPNQIKNYTFTTTGRGAYKASEVDEFIEKVYVDFSSIYSERSSLVKKFSSLSNAIDEYNASKNAIATALVNAQAIADDTINNAKEKAEEIIREAEDQAKVIAEEKSINADKYAESKIASADEYHNNVMAEAQKLIEQSKIQSDEFIGQINLKINECIADANEKAAKILEEAYQNANNIREEANKVIISALGDYERVKNSVEAFKNDSLEVLKSIIPILENLSIEDSLGLKMNEQTEVEVPAAISINDVPKFSVESSFVEVTPEEESVSDDADDEVDADVDVNADDINVDVDTDIDIDADINIDIDVDVNADEVLRDIFKEADFEFKIPEINFDDIDTYTDPQFTDMPSEEEYAHAVSSEDANLFDEADD